MGSRGRGGYQKPSAPAAVSGPGSLAQRTDGGPGQPLRPIAANRPGGQQGDRQASIEQQKSAPLREGGVETPPVAGPGPEGAMQAEPPSIPADQVFGPSQRPWEPVTAGATMGPGAQPDQAAMIADQVRALYQQYPYDGVRALLEEIDTNRGAL